MKILRVLLFACLGSGIVTTPVAAAEKTKVVPESKLQMQLSYAPLVKQSAPAVVNVYATRVVQSNYRSDPFFNRFFDRRGFGVPKERVQSSLGSGVIVREDGIIVTNNHVIAGGNEFKVALADRREFDAEVILQDERTDLAVLRINPGREQLPVLKFHDSDIAEVGDLVLAIGNPFGVGQTVTSGIISALARTQVGVSDYQFFIQTDAAVNPGNSGGALVNMEGDLIGVNTAIFSRSGGSNGIGFAIPSNMVRLVVESALSDGKVRRPWLGASGQVVTADIAKSLGLDRPAGILISQVHPNGPADKAGLDIGDVVLAIDDFEVYDVQSLRYRIATQELGKSIKLRYLRNGKAKSSKLKLTEPPAHPKPDETLLEGRQPLAGATVANLSPALNEEFGFDTTKTGVVVVSVARGEAAAQVGLTRGDIVRTVNGVEIEDVRDLEDEMSYDTRRWNLVLSRNGRERRVNLRY